MLKIYQAIWVGVFITQAWASSPIVTVAQGVVSGTTTVVTLASATTSSVTVSKYIGIPFASNIPKRFAAPDPVHAWTTTLYAVTTQPACIQPILSPDESRIFNNPGGPAPPESEDCLYLNIYVPPGTKPKANLAVMFWIFGGNLAFGDGSLLIYDGSSFAANQKVIVVTINYRTNIFGFSMSPEVPLSSRNAGFLDQRMALKWVYDNIEAFGGCPDSITIFGQSAGGYSVEQLIAYPPKTPFRGAILQSRGFLGPTNDTSWQQAVAAVNCTNSTSELACMRRKTALEIKDATSSITFGPVMDNKTYAHDIRSRLGNGAVNVPVMLGTNGQEGNVYGYLLDLPQATADLVTAVSFTCTTSLLATTLYNASYPIWRYYFNASFPDTSYFPNAYAYHSSEIGMVFGTYPRNNSYGSATTQQIALSHYMQTAWANFAKDPCDGPKMGWPQLSSGVQDLGGDASKGGYAIPADEIDDVCAPYYPLISAYGY